MQVLDRIYERFAPPVSDTLTDSAGPGRDGNAAVRLVLSEDAAAVLEDLLVFYDRLAKSGARDARYHEKVALGNRRGGDIRHHLSQFEQATEAYQRELDIYLELDPSSLDKRHVVAIASVYIELGIMAHRSGPLVSSPHHRKVRHRRVRLQSCGPAASPDYSRDPHATAQDARWS